MVFIFHIQTKWHLHLPQWQQTSAMTQLYGKQHLPKISIGFKPKVTTTCHIQHPKMLAKIYSKIYTIYDIHANIWQKIPTKIIKNNIPHAPSKVGVMVR